jgi:hypothetical protein
MGRMGRMVIMREMGGMGGIVNPGFLKTYLTL